MGSYGRGVWLKEIHKETSMNYGKRFGSPVLSALAAFSMLVFAGWNVQAGARQTRPKPFVPNPSSVRPIGRAQPSAVPAPVSQAGAKNQPPSAAPAPSNSGDTKQ